MDAPRRVTDSSWFAAGAATLFLVLSVGVVWFARAIAGVEDGAVLTALIVVPALLYVVLRGSLAELRAPGGWVASFVRVARTTVNAGGENRLNVDELQIIQKEGTNALTARLANIEPDQPVLMCLKVGRAYSAGDIESYLDILSQFPRFRLVALLKTGDEFVGCISPTELRAVVRNEERSFRFEQAVRTGNAVDIKHFPGVATQFIRLEATNVETLSVMVANNLNAIAVVDQNRTLRGVVERELLVSKLVLSLAGTSVASGSY